MMKRSIFLALLSLCLAQAGRDSALAGQESEVQKPKRLEYRLEPVLSKDHLRFRVELEFDGDPTGKIEIVLPSEWAGQARLYNAIKNLKVLTPGATISDTDKPHIKLVSHPPNKKLRIGYDLVGEQAAASSGERNTAYRPIIKREYFHFLGSASLVRPGWKDEQEMSVSIEWKKLPRQWALANSFGAGAHVQRFNTAVGGLISSVFVGGDFRLRPVTVSGKPVYVALRGSWKFTDEEFASLVEKIVAVERGFWNDFDYPHYLITLLPIENARGGASYSGAGLTRSFATFATTSTTLDDFKFLLAHELFHNWNSPRLGRMKQPEQRLYWFSEGFTNYYTYLLLLRGGLITFDDYLAKYNEALRGYHTSPVRNVTNERVSKEFFTNNDVSQLAYWRGMLLAANWNALIRKTTSGANSLDDVMRDMLKEAEKQKGRELNETVIAEHVRRYAGNHLLDDIGNYVEHGGTILMDNYALSPCAQQGIAGIASFEPGFDLEALRSKQVIAGVKPQSAAYRAGLRDGQTVVRRAPIHLGDPEKQIEITVKEGEQEKTIRFYPASLARARVPQFRLRPGLSDKQMADCRNW